MYDYIIMLNSFDPFIKLLGPILAVVILKVIFVVAVSNPFLYACHGT